MVGSHHGGISSRQGTLQTSLCELTGWPEVLSGSVNQVSVDRNMTSLLNTWILLFLNLATEVSNGRFQGLQLKTWKEVLEQSLSLNLMLAVPVKQLNKKENQ